MSRRIRIVGLDPGLVRTGWGAIDVDGPRLLHVANGHCASGTGTLAARLAILYRSLIEVVERFGPDEAAVEESFVNRNPATALKLGHARGVCLVVPALLDVPLAEYAPNAVKRAVVGAGHADKRQIEYMVRMLLPGAKIESEHSADALAVAICHASNACGVVGRISGRIARRAVPVSASE